MLVAWLSTINFMKKEDKQDMQSAKKSQKKLSGLVKKQFFSNPDTSQQVCLCDLD